MKVMIFNSLYQPNIIGGAEKSIQIIAENLKKFDIEPIVISISDKEKIYHINGVKVYYIYHSNVYWSYYSKTKKAILKPFWHFFSLYNFIILNRINKIIKEEKPDIAHTNNLSEFSIGVWKVLKRSRVPVVHTLRDYSLLCPRATLFRRNNNCEKENIICKTMLAFRRKFSRYVDLVVGNSDFILKKHIESGFFKKAKIRVIFNSLESGKINKRKVKTNNLSFGFIGMLSPHKGIEILLEAFQGISNVDLHIFGRGVNQEYEDHLKDKYHSEKIRFHGFVKTEKAFRSIDVLIVPSIWNDPLPRVIYEAYSFGVPVIGSNRGGTPEIIDEDRTGFIFDPDLKEDLINKINIFNNNPKIIEGMYHYCIEKAIDFLPEKVVKRYIAVYKEVL